jgi:hypothetical protein
VAGEITVGSREQGTGSRDDSRKKSARVVEFPVAAGEPELKIEANALSEALIAALVEEVIVPGIRDQGSGTREHSSKKAARKETE